MCKKNNDITLHSFVLQLPPIVPGAPVKINFKVSAIVDKYDGLPPQDLTTENSFVRVMVVKSDQVNVY